MGLSLTTMPVRMDVTRTTARGRESEIGLLCQVLSTSGHCNLVTRPENQRWQE